MTDSYHKLYKRRIMRAYGLEEIVKITNEIDYFNVLLSTESILNKSYYYKVARQIMENFKRDYSIILEQQLEAYNCAYEAFLPFKREKLYKRLKKWIKI